MKNFKTIIATIAIVMAANFANAQLGTCNQACPIDAGSDVSTCCQATLGGSPTGPSCGGQTSTYSWAPSTGLSCTTCANPVCTITSGSVTYTVTVTIPSTCCCTAISGNCNANPSTCPAKVKTDQVTVTFLGPNCCRIMNPDSYSETQNPKMKVVPKQTAGLYELEIEEPNENTKIHVYNSDGISVFGNDRVITSTFTIDISKQARGDYFIEIKNGEEVSVFKKVVVE